MKKRLLFAVALLVSTLTFAQKNARVASDSLGEYKGSTIRLFTLVNKAGNVLKVTNYGARIVRIEVPDKLGIRDNVTLGSDTYSGIVSGDLYGGASIGRFANRIANGKFSLDGKEYTLRQNNGVNSLHGGPTGWHARVWSSETLQGKTAAVRFSYLSPDMEEGFPGTIRVSVTYTWTDKNELIIDYAATTDQKTVFNTTNHAYFNLHGVGKGAIFDQVLTIYASAYTPVNSTQIPTGEIRAVKGTPFDFTTGQSVGSKIGTTYENAPINGFDHNYVLDKKQKVQAKVYDPQSGRVMEVITDQPGMQFYSGNGSAWKRAVDAGNAYVNARSGLALETQYFPDSPNQPTFPSTVLNSGQHFKSRTIYRFSVEK
jgi:aldose 1-epimerase